MGLAIFEIGALGFWVLCAVASIIIICLLSIGDNPKYGLSTIFVLGIFVLVYYFGGRVGLNGLGIWIKEHMLYFAILLLLYILIGILWSFAEWFYFVKKMATKAKDGSLSIEYYKPKISKEKERIFTWIFYWPWIMLWKAIHKPFQRIFNLIYTHTEATYERITQNAFKGLEKEKEK